jgi:PAS domain S-box-containing protein
VFTSWLESEKAIALVKDVLVTKAQRAIEAGLGSPEQSLWVRLHFRPVRAMDDREKMVLVLLEDLSHEKEQINLSELHRAVLEQQVQERTKELESSNRKLLEEIENHRQTEAALRKAELIFRAVFESSSDCMFIKDSKLRLTHVNKATEQMLGIPANEILGHTIAEILPMREATKAYVEQVERRVLTGEAVEDERAIMVRGALTVRHGVRIPLRDANGDIFGLCGILRDITDRRGEAFFVSSRPAAKTASPKMKAVLEKALLASHSESTALILGETGVGKDHLARFMHQHSRRQSGSFITANCAALPGPLVESEFFGHEQGAFTGAKRRKKGLLELAEGGTLLLNEIGETPLNFQAKLVTFLDTKQFMRVGGPKFLSANVRLIFATNRGLSEEVKAGRFRRDLFYRINVVSLEVPPLRERLEDIPELAREILRELGNKMGLTNIPRLTENALKQLRSYQWPGNVRELENVLERSLILSSGFNEEFRIAGLDTGENWCRHITFPDGRPFNSVIEDLKLALIEEAMRRSGNNQKKAAHLLGLPYVSFRHFLKKLHE